jgi:hypothetical protein
MHLCPVIKDRCLKTSIGLNCNIDKFEHFNWYLCRPVSNYNKVVLHFIECMHVHLESFGQR